MSYLSAAGTVQSASPWGQEFFLLQNVRPGSWAHPASYSMDTGVKHSGREVYHWSPPSVKVMNEWSCISAFPMSSWCGQELFLIFHMRATFRAHHVMRLICSEAPVQMSACCYLPGPHIQRPHLSALQPPLSASPAHHASFVYRENGGHFKFHHLAGFSVLYLAVSYPHHRSPYARHEGL